MKQHTTECTSTCPSSFYGKLSTLTCEPCDSTCLTCTDNATHCQSCTNVSGIPYYNHNLAECIVSCYTGYYGSVVNNTCVLCWEGCSVCFGGDSFSCTQCHSTNATVYYLVHSSTNCNVSCPAGQYGVDITNTCQLCDVNCFTCDVSATNCTSCSTTSLGVRLFLENFACVQTCSTGSYQRLTDSTCQACNPGCSVCTGPSLFECPSCQDTVDPANTSNTLSYYLNIGNTICSLECPVGQYRRIGFPNVCQMCASECIGCFNTSTNCTELHKCAVNFYFYRPTNSCISACPEQYYTNGTTQMCEQCAGGCFACLSGDLLNCQSCQDDPATNVSYFKEISYDWCVADCLPGEYSVLSDHSCRLCFETCSVCLGSPTNCQQCKNVSGVNYFHLGSTCLATCPTGYYG